MDKIIIGNNIKRLIKERKKSDYKLLFGGIALSGIGFSLDMIALMNARRAADSFNAAQFINNSSVVK